MTYKVHSEYKNHCLEMRVTKIGTDLTAFARVPSRLHDPNTYATLLEFLKASIEGVNFEDTLIVYKEYKWNG